MKKELFNQYCNGQLKTIGICNDTVYSGIKVIQIIYGVDDLVFGVTYYPKDGGEIEKPFLVKLNGNSFRVNNITYNINNVIRII